jgi:hypothetical protein
VNVSRRRVFLIVALWSLASAVVSSSLWFTAYVHRFDDCEVVALEPARKLAWICVFDDFEGRPPARVIPGQPA